MTLPGDRIGPSTILDEVTAEAFCAFYPWLVRVCLELVHDSYEAEDLAQTALMRAIEHIDRFDSQGPAWPWLRRIARNACLDHLRKQGRVYARERMPECGTDTPTLEQRVVDIDISDLMLKELPLRQATALRLYSVKGWSRKQVADHFDVTVAAIDQLLHRARRNALVAYRRLLDSEMAVLLGGWLARLRSIASRMLSRVDAPTPLSSMMSELVVGIVAGVIALMGPTGGSGPAADGAAVPAQSQDRPSVPARLMGAVTEATERPVPSGYTNSEGLQTRARELGAKSAWLWSCTGHSISKLDLPHAARGRDRPRSPHGLQQGRTR